MTTNYKKTGGEPSLYKSWKMIMIMMIMMIIQFNSLLFMCRVNSQTANYRQHGLDGDIYIIDKHKLQASTDGRGKK
jgi:hypothetical protein